MTPSHTLRQLFRSCCDSPLVKAGTLLLAAIAFTLPASAAPVTYTGFVITSGKLGGWEFHNAQVYLTLQSDTNNVQNVTIQLPCLDPTMPPNCVPPPPAAVALNATGTARVTIITSNSKVTATFAPNQILVSADQGDAPAIPGAARGIGFGSFTPNGGIEPAYPMAIEDGTIDGGDVSIPSPGLASLLTLTATDLKHDTGFSGRAWTCVGFNPDNLGPCNPPTALKTNKGDLYLFQPYQRIFNPGGLGDTLNGGFFFVNVGSTDTQEEEIDYTAQDRPKTTSSSITYAGFTIADVSLGGNTYNGAGVYLFFDANTSTVVPLTGSTNGFANYVGKGHLKVISGSGSATAQFAPGEVYVYYDVANASIGFGSNTGGRAYPLVLTPNDNSDGLVSNSTLGAVVDLTTTPADAANYTPETATLATNLTNATALSGSASSCAASALQMMPFNAATSICNNFVPVALQTDQGNFFIFEPYTGDDGSGSFSVNWGLFWATVGRN